MAFGTPGGDQQDQWSLHFFLGVALRAPVRGGLDLQGAIDAPNWHNDSFPSSFHPREMRPGSLTVESRFEESVIAGLRGRGHDVTVSAPGPRAVCAPWPATRRPACCPPPPTPAGCRATRWAADRPPEDGR